MCAARILAGIDAPVIRQETARLGPYLKIVTNLQGEDDLLVQANEWLAVHKQV